MPGPVAAVNVVVCDTLPAHMTFSSAPGASFVGGKACWTFSRVVSGGSRTMRVIAKVDADAPAGAERNLARAASPNAGTARAAAIVHILAHRAAVSPGDGMTRGRGRGRRPVALVLVAAGACTAHVEPGTVPSASPQALAPVGPAQAIAYRPFFPMTIARLMTPTAALSSPGGPRVVENLSTSVRPGGGPTELLVLRQRRVLGASGSGPPARPSQQRDRVDRRRHDGAVDHAVAHRRLDGAADGGRVLERTTRPEFSAVVGAPGSPTPHGLFAVLERVSTGSPNGFYGSWVLTLTAHSNVYQHFNGGDGRVAIHGRGGASLTVPLRTAGSHGCVRLDNAAVDWLAAVAVPGTPVEID